MTKEELRKEVKKDLELMCLAGACVEWEVVKDMYMLKEVVTEELMSDAELRERITEGAGEMCDIEVSFRSGGGRPAVSVDFKVKPIIRRVGEADLGVVMHQWKKNGYEFICMQNDDVDPSPRNIAMEVKLKNIEYTFVEFVVSDNKVLARHLLDPSGKHRYRNREIFQRLSQEMLYGENGIIPTMMPL